MNVSGGYQNIQDLHRFVEVSNKKCDVCGNVQCKLVSHLSHSSSKLLGIFYAQSFLLCWQNCTLQGHSSNNLFGQNIMKTFDLRIIWKSVKYRMQVTALIYMRTLHVHIDHCIQAVALVSSCTTRESFSSYKNNTISLSITCSTHYLILISPLATFRFTILIASEIFIVFKIGKYVSILIKCERSEHS